MHCFCLKFKNKNIFYYLLSTLVQYHIRAKRARFRPDPDPSKKISISPRSGSEQKKLGSTQIQIRAKKARFYPDPESSKKKSGFRPDPDPSQKSSVPPRSESGFHITCTILHLVYIELWELGHDQVVDGDVHLHDVFPNLKKNIFLNN